MPQTQLSPSAGSKNTIFDLKEEKNVARSHFPYSMKKFDTLDLGDLIVADWYPVYPGDHIKQSCRYIIDTLPLEVPPMTTFFVRTHWYFIKKSALWQGWETHITKGRSGSITINTPTVPATAFASSFGEGLSEPRLDSPSSLACHFGLPPRCYPASDSDVGFQEPIIAAADADDTSVDGVGYLWPANINILPFMAYQKIWRYNYAPANLLQDNKIYFPDDLASHWWLNYSATNLRGLAFVPEDATLPSDGTERDWVVPRVDSGSGTDGSNCCNLGLLRYANYQIDYFTSAKPWLVRGEETTLNLTSSKTYSEIASKLGAGIESVTDLFSDLFTGDFPLSMATNNSVGTSFASWTDSQKVSAIPNATDAKASWNNVFGQFARKIAENVSQNMSVYAKSGSGKLDFSVGFTANTLRNLLAISVWQERNSTVNGNYNEMVRMHFGRSPKSPEYEPVYLGGSTDVVSFAPVIQTSASQSNQPLGTKAALGSASGGAQLFEFDSHEFGYIIGLMFIAPETIYQGNIDREWTDIQFAQEFMPEKANLGFEPIFNQELFARSNASDNVGLWGYQTKYAYLKHRRNLACGMFALPSSVDNLFGSQVIRRIPQSGDKLSAQWLSLYKNVSRDWLSYPDYPAFKLQFASDVNLVRALPFQSTPETFGF